MDRKLIRHLQIPARAKRVPGYLDQKPQVRLQLASVEKHTVTLPDFFAGAVLQQAVHQIISLAFAATNAGRQQAVYRIGREAVTNAFRHSGATTIEVELEYGVHELRLLVRDDGHGIDPQVLHAGREGYWGLSGMRERAETIGAKLNVWSKATAGTESEIARPRSQPFQISDFKLCL